ncbi:adenylyltransferase/cytidyltransferase family protein [Candidatus Gracilibacteria bacterium]|nr:adenylyltransferase/cytidyltransferase family protein [Candidatus Gracilibacteria bacterium]
MTKLAITSGYFNPLHPGHVDCFEMSRSVAGADEVWVIVNNDRQAFLKRGVESFQNELYRCRLVSALKSVDRTFLSVDEDGSVCQSLVLLIEEAKKTGKYDEIIFTKGGDRFAANCPETAILAENNVAIVDGLGAKTHNSSDYAIRKQA